MPAKSGGAVVQSGPDNLEYLRPTEATVTATMTLLAPDKPVTIGRPLPSYSIAILHPTRPELALPGEMGEIGIAGIGLAVGYLNLQN